MHFFKGICKEGHRFEVALPKRKVTMNVCTIWPFVQISDDFYYLGIWQCARYFVAALLKELALIRGD